MTALDNFQDALTAAGSHGKGSAWTCPNHEDRTASLSVNQGSKGVVFTCHAGCDHGAIMNSLSLTESDLFDDELPPQSREPEKIYNYVDQDGVLLFQKLRYPGKKFFQRKPSPVGGWSWKLDGVERVLYNLPEVANAKTNGETVYVVEGERDADTLIQMGLVATTNFDGAGKWRQAYNEFFEGLDVVILGDNDSPGHAHMRLVEKNIMPYAASVQMVISPFGKDITDHLGLGHDLDELVPLGDEVLVADEPIDLHLTNEGLREASQSNPMLNLDGSVNWDTLWESADTSTAWLVEPFLVKAMTHSLWGTPGHGKSLVALETVVHHLLPHTHVLYVDNENHLVNVIFKRLISFGCKPEDLSSLHFYSFSQMPPLDTVEGGIELLRLARMHNATLVVIDTFSRFIDGPEDKSDTFKDFYNYSLMSLKRNDIASLRLDHPGKDVSRGTRGSSAKYGDIDFEFSVEDPGDGKTPYRKLKCTKSRTGDPELGSITMLRKNYAADGFRHDWLPDSKVVSIKASDDAELIKELGVTSRRKIQDALVTRGIKMGVSRIEAARTELGFVSESVSGD